MQSNIQKSNNNNSIFLLGAFISYLYNGITGPLFIVYLLSIHLNITYIGIILAAQRLAIILFEFPTGLFADKYGRKKSLLLSYLLSAILFLAWFFTKDFYTLLCLSFSMGISYTFQSGAKESLMIDNLDLANNDEKRNKTFSRIAIIGNAGGIVGGLIASFLAWYNIKLIWLAASGLNIILLLLFALFSRETNNQALTANKIIIKPFSLLKEIANKKILKLLIIVAALFGFVIAVYNLAYPIFLRDFMNLPDYLFGLLGSLSAVLGIISAWLVNKAVKKFNYHIILISIITCLLAFFILFGLTNTIIAALILFGAIEFFVQAWHPVYQSFFNKFIDSKIRTSILSLSSVVTLSSIVVAEILAGYILISIFPGNLLIITAGLFIPILIIIILLQIYNRTNYLFSQKASASTSILLKRM